MWNYPSNQNSKPQNLLKRHFLTSWNQSAKIDITLNYCGRKISIFPHFLYWIKHSKFNHSHFSVKTILESNEVNWDIFFLNMHWYTVQWVKLDVGWSLRVKSCNKLWMKSSWKIDRKVWSRKVQWKVWKCVR